MISIDPNALYSRADLVDMLAPAGVDVDTFTARLSARKVFKQLWLGADLLDAYRNAPELMDHAGANRTGKGGAKNIDSTRTAQLIELAQGRRTKAGDPLGDLLKETRP